MNAPLRTLSLFARALLFFVIFGGFAAPASAGVILSEIFYDAEGSDDGHVFVELAGPPGTLLDGWQVEGVNGFNGAVGDRTFKLASGTTSEYGRYVKYPGGAP